MDLPWQGGTGSLLFSSKAKGHYLDDVRAAVDIVQVDRTVLLYRQSFCVSGVVSAYVPNRATGEILPGLAVVTDVAEFHKMVHSFKNFEEALSEQTSPTEAPVVPPTEPVTPGSRGSDGAV